MNGWCRCVRGRDYEDAVPERVSKNEEPCTRSRALRGASPRRKTRQPIQLAVLAMRSPSCGRRGRRPPRRRVRSPCGADLSHVRPAFFGLELRRGCGRSSIRRKYYARLRSRMWPGGFKQARGLFRQAVSNAPATCGTWQNLGNAEWQMRPHRCGSACVGTGAMASRRSILNARANLRFARRAAQPSDFGYCSRGIGFVPRGCR